MQSQRLSLSTSKAVTCLTIWHVQILETVQLRRSLYTLEARRQTVAKYILCSVYSLQNKERKRKVFFSAFFFCSPKPSQNSPFAFGRFSTLQFGSNNSLLTNIDFDDITIDRDIETMHPNEIVVIIFLGIFGAAAF